MSTYERCPCGGRMVELFVSVVCEHRDCPAEGRRAAGVRIQDVGPIVAVPRTASWLDGPSDDPTRALAKEVANNFAKLLSGAMQRILWDHYAVAPEARPSNRLWGTDPTPICRFLDHGEGLEEERYTEESKGQFVQCVSYSNGVEVRRMVEVQPLTATSIELRFTLNDGHRNEAERLAAPARDDAPATLSDD